MNVPVCTLAANFNNATFYVSMLLGFAFNAFIHFFLLFRIIFEDRVFCSCQPDLSLSVPKDSLAYSFVLFKMSVSGWQGAEDAKISKLTNGFCHLSSII